jgi:hypothetical protein
MALGLDEGSRCCNSGDAVCGTLQHGFWSWACVEGRGMRSCCHSVAQRAVAPSSLADHVAAIAVTATAAVAAVAYRGDKNFFLVAAVACRGDKSFFLVTAVGGAALLGGLYLFLNSQL